MTTQKTFSQQPSACMQEQEDNILQAALLEIQM